MDGRTSCKKGQHIVSVRELVVLILCVRHTDMLIPTTEISQICQAVIVNIIYVIVGAGVNLCGLYGGFVGKFKNIIILE